MALVPTNDSGYADGLQCTKHVSVISKVNPAENHLANMGDHVRYHPPSDETDSLVFPEISEGDMAKHPLTLGMTSMINTADVERIAEIQAAM